MKASLAAASIWLVLLATPAWSQAESLREESRKVIEAGGIEGVDVENPRGRITVSRSADSKIHLSALKLVRARDSEQTREFARETQVSLSTKGERCVIRVSYPRRQAFRVSFWDFFSGFEWPSVEVRLALQVPDGLRLWLNSASGDLATEDMSGGQVLETTSGDISVRSSSGPVEVSTTSGDVSGAGLGPASIRTVSGDIEITGARGAIRASATSGSITVDGAEDSLSVSTVSGDIRASAAPRGLFAKSSSGAILVRSVGGMARVETSSGDARLGLDAGVRRAEATTGSGDLEVELAPTLGCDVEMRTSSGSLDVMVPLETKVVSRHLVSGRVGRGGAAIKLRSSSGDITVRRERN